MDQFKRENEYAKIIFPDISVKSWTHRKLQSGEGFTDQKRITHETW